MQHNILKKEKKKDNKNVKIVGVGGQDWWKLERGGARDLKKVVCRSC